MTKIGGNCSLQWFISGITAKSFRVDAYPRQEGLLSFNSDYMVWYSERQRCLLTHKMQTRLHWYFFNLFEYLTMNIFLMMTINFLTLIIAGWNCGDITVYGVFSREEYMDNWWSRALSEKNYNFIRRARESHWASVTWLVLHQSVNFPHKSFTYFSRVLKLRA